MNEQRNFDDVKVVTHDDFQTQSMTDLVQQGEVLHRQQTKYVTAISVIKPRQLDKVRQMVLSEVELDPESAYYEWEVWDKRKGEMVPITGISIDSAMNIARNFGNSAIDVQVEENQTHYIFYPVFFDLETGFTNTRAFRQRKNQNLGGKMERDRAEDIAFQIGQSKAIRNVIKNSVPASLTRKVLSYAKELVIKQVNADGIENSRKGAVQSFEEIGISLEQLSIYTGITDPDKWSAEVIAKLRTAYKAIENGDVAKTELFPPIEKKPEEKITGDQEALKKKPGRPSKTEAEQQNDVEPTGKTENKQADDQEAINLFGGKLPPATK